MIERLGQLMWKLQGAALILCVDQLEDVAIQDGAAKLFPRAITGLIQVSAQVPSSMIVISCLEDYYVELKQHLLAPARDRIEKDPQPLKLQGGRTWSEITEVVEMHLSHLYDHCDVPVDPLVPTYPVPDELLRDNVQQTTRTVLNACKRYRETCIRDHRVVQPKNVARRL